MLKKVEEFEIKRRGTQLNIMLVILICFEIMQFSEGNFKSRKCLGAREVQFKA